LLTLFTYYRFTAKQNGTFYLRTGFLTQLLACESIQWCKVLDNVYSDLLGQNMLFFPIKLLRDEWSLFVVVALPYFGKRGPKVPMLYYFDPIGSFGDEADVLDKGNRIRVLLILLWRQKFRSKVDKIDNPFNKRSLPLKCFKSESNYHPFFWEFSKFRKIPSNSLKLSYHLVLNCPVQLGIFQILENSLKLSSVH
jgi:hypothetical protein